MSFSFYVPQGVFRRKLLPHICPEDPSAASVSPGEDRTAPPGAHIGTDSAQCDGG